MDKNIKEAIERYQCPGCMVGGDIECYGRGLGLECGKHIPGTFMVGVGKLFLGMPKGFNRVGSQFDMKINIARKFENIHYDKWNIPVWKFKNEFNQVLVRGVSPRLNCCFLDIILEDCLEKINCLEIKQQDIDGMD